MQITLKAARVNQGLTLIEASNLLGISRNTLGSWEKSKTFPNTKNIRKIEEVYKISYDNIIFLPNKHD